MLKVTIYHNRLQSVLFAFSVAFDGPTAVFQTPHRQGGPESDGKPCEMQFAMELVSSIEPASPADIAHLLGVF